MVSIIVAVYLVQAGHGAAGVALILAEVAALAGAFLIGRWDRARSRKDSSREENGDESSDKLPD